MPVLDGFETLKKVKEIFDAHNTRANDESSEHPHIEVSRPLALRPFICMFSQLDGRQFAPFLSRAEQPDFYLKKPISASELKSFLRLLSVLWTIRYISILGETIYIDLKFKLTFIS